MNWGAGAQVAVLLPMPFEGPLDYIVPEGIEVSTGDFVTVELGARQTLGVVWGPGETSGRKLKEIGLRLDAPPMTGPMRQFLARAADYTLTPPGMMLRLATRVPELGAAPRMRSIWRPGPGTPDRMTPARARVLQALADHGGAGFSTADLARTADVSASVIHGLGKQGVIEQVEVPADPPFPPLFGQRASAHLNAGQAEAAGALRAAVAAETFSTTLLYGVTGSGKTEVYLEAIAECLARGRQALVLLPEVALTAGFLDRVEARFGARPAEWHHGVAARDRRRCWHAAADGSASLVVGARSALFLPFRSLGLIVVDEEHETSFKQEDIVLYNARDMAVLRASIEDVPAVLASATPSLESWANAEAGKYRRLDLPDRFGAAVLPKIGLIDLRLNNPGHNRWISQPLESAARARLDAGEQVLFFLNRRGYAPLTLCRACAHKFGCPNCDSWMVTHRFHRQLLCHQCGHTERLPTACPGCGRDDRLAVAGPGVERLAEEAMELFPEARLRIVSSDLVTGPDALRQHLTEIAAGAVDIVVGTQMIAKGHNFPLLTLVGVIDADMGLQGGDLRAAERTFQVLHQVAGRAGRNEKPGAALIQTVAPDHAVLRAILANSPEAFWRQEAEMRHAAGAPPFGRMAGVIVSGAEDARVWDTANALGRAGGRLHRAGAELFGPAPAPISRVRGRARVRLLIKAPKGLTLQPLIRDWLAEVKTPASVRVVVDIDPQSFL